MPIARQNRTPLEPKSTAAIRRIRIERLFGRYTYDLRSDGPSPEASRLLILYGDNGSGKTTVLNLVFNLLSHVDNQGHKTYLAKARFKKLIVDLGTNIQVGAVRRGKSLIGAYTAYIRRKGRTIGRIGFLTDAENDIIRQTSKSYEARLGRFLRSLENLKLAIFFVTDERRLLQNTRQTQETEARSSIRFRTTRTGRLRRVEAPLRSMHLDAAVSRAIAAAVVWTKEQVLSGSKQGEADANTIYAEIVRRIASVPTLKAERTDMKRLIAVLEEQAARSQEFAKFGFPSAVNMADLVRSLTLARKELPTISKIVKPFADTTRAKLDALQEVHDSVSGFVAAINSFFKDKKVYFNLDKGVAVVADDGTPLPLSNLSSGEKQLLLLFCNTLMTREQETICLIDEPEISLNIKWQRNLIRSLLESTKRRNVQFVLATHSFELFAPHKRNVLELVNQHAVTRDAPATDTQRVAGDPRARI